MQLKICQTIAYKPRLELKKKNKQSKESHGFPLSKSLVHVMDHLQFL